MSFYNGQPVAAAASDAFDAINAALTHIGINSEMVLVGAMATVRVEVGRTFLPIEEQYIKPGLAFVGAEYEGRNDLGNTQVGDGNRFRGRGFIQLTGRANYAAYGAKVGMNLAELPEIALNPPAAAAILAQYFKDHGVDVACNAQNWALARQRVNGGNGVDVTSGGTTHGVLDFEKIINQYTT